MKRIAVDFDGTLFADEYPKIGKPKWRVINWCKERKRKGDVLILCTCREGESLREAVEMCREVGLVFDYVNQNDASLKKQFGNDCRKVGADIYLDDKAMRIEDIRLSDEEMVTLLLKFAKAQKYNDNSLELNELLAKVEYLEALYFDVAKQEQDEFERWLYTLHCCTRGEDENH